jgi:putative AbiEi antitoxin of type IV toxin-antitoxin system
MDLLTRQQLMATGYSGDEIDRMAAKGALVRVRRGLYSSRATRPVDPEEEHLGRVRAVVAATRSDHVVSHVSAAVVHDLPVPRDAGHAWQGPPHPGASRGRQAAR